MVTGKHVHLHIISPEDEVVNAVDALVLSAYSTSDDVPVHLVDLAYVNKHKAGPGILDRLDFRLGVKHKNHEDIAAGKELFYYTFPDSPVPTLPLPQEANQQDFMVTTASDDEVYQSVVSQIMNNIPLNPPDGANLQQFIEAINRFANEQKAQLDSAERVDHALEEALDEAEDRASQAVGTINVDPQMTSTTTGVELPTPTSYPSTTPTPTEEPTQQPEALKGLSI